MIKRFISCRIPALIGFICCAGVYAQSTGISYQGRLLDGGNPASGQYDLKFELFDDPTGGSSWGTVLKFGTVVSNGLFTVQLDFGPGVFDGTDLWLEIRASTIGAEVLSTLSPRQPITSAPYAIKAAEVEAGGVVGALGSSQIGDGSITAAKLTSSAVTSSSISDGSIDGVDIADGAVGKDDLSAAVLSNTFWRLDGNMGTTVSSFIGTGDSQPLKLKVNNKVGFRIEYPTTGSIPNIIGGASNNSIGNETEGAVVAGGASNTIGVDSDVSTVGGGNFNNIASNSVYASILGGRGNDIGVNSISSTVGGGYDNNILDNSLHATISGGNGNDIGSNSGQSTVGGGNNNNIASNSTAATISGGVVNNIGVNSVSSTVGGGYDNNVASDSSYATIAGGVINDIGINADYSAVGGGYNNNIADNTRSATIAGGEGNDIGANSDYSVVAGGVDSDVGDGAQYAFAAGRQAKANHTGVFVWADSTAVDFASAANNEFAVRALGGVRFETGGAGITVDGGPLLLGIDSVGSSEIAADAVGSDEIAPGAVGSSEIATDAIGSDEIAIDAVGSDEIATGAVGPDEIANGAVDSSKIVDGAVLAEISDDDGAGSGLDADLLDGVSSAGFWKTTGNSNTVAGTHFIGTTDDQPLELRVNNLSVLRIEYTSILGPNIIGGSPANSIGSGTSGAVIAGGIFNKIGENSDVGTVSGGNLNNIASNSAYASISGGRGNEIGAGSSSSTVGGGYGNNISSNSSSATISGGRVNAIGDNSAGSSIAGGEGNDIGANSDYSVVAGGVDSDVGDGAQYAFAAGRRAKANHSGAFVWADSQNADFASTTNNEFAVRALGGVRFETGGAGLTVDGGPLLLGIDSVGSSEIAADAVGSDEIAIGAVGSSEIATDAVGSDEIATDAVGSDEIAIGAVGPDEIANGAVDSSKIMDGAVLAEIADDDGAGSGLDADLLDGVSSAGFWQTAGNSGIIPGSHFIGTTDSQPLELRVNNANALRIVPPTTGTVPNIIGGSWENSIGNETEGAVIAGGYINNISSNAPYAAIAGGHGNKIAAFSSRAVIAGGYNNDIGVNADFSTVGGGYNNNIESDSPYVTIAGGYINDIGVVADYSAVGGGYNNNIGGGSYSATIAGGQANDIGQNADYSTVGGGYNNNIGDNSYAATIVGGQANDIGLDCDFSTVGGGYDCDVLDYMQYAYAAGRRAKANHYGAFVWADGQNADFSTIANNEFAVRASGGMRVLGSSTMSTLMVAPNQTVDGDDSQIFLAEDHDGNFGMLLRYNGGLNQLQIYGKENLTEKGPHVVINRSTGSFGVGRSPTGNAFEVEGNASKTTSGSWLANSDARIKRDVETVTHALDTLDQVRLVSFRYTDDYRKAHPSVENRRYLNVVAQEFREVFPEHVKSSGETLPDGSEILQVDIHPLIIYSAKAIQELNSTLELKDKEIADLTSRLDKLEKIMASQFAGAEQ